MVIESYNKDYGKDKNDNLYRIQGGYQKHVEDLVVNIGKPREYAFEFTSRNPFKPALSLIIKYPEDENKPIERQASAIEIYYFKRTGLDKFEIVDFKEIKIIGMRFDDVRALASKYDLSTDFEGKDNYDITVYPPLTKEEIEQNKKAKQKIEDEEKQVKEEQDKYNALTKDEKKQYLEDELSKYKEAKEQLTLGKTTYNDGTPIILGDLREQELLPVIEGLLIPETEKKLLELEKETKNSQS